MSTSTNVSKPCISCKQIKPIKSFYKHSKMSDGHLNKCKLCVKEVSKKRFEKIKSDPVLLEKERARNREKYHRLNYKDMHKPSYEAKKKAIHNYKEKYPEKVKAKNFTSSLKKKNPNNHFHHWSYNDEHFKDVIELSIDSHNKAHRFLTYDRETKMYKDINGNILHTKEKHERYINDMIA